MINNMNMMPPIVAPIATPAAPPGVLMPAGGWSVGVDVVDKVVVDAVELDAELVVEDVGTIEHQQKRTEVMW